MNINDIKIIVGTRKGQFVTVKTSKVITRKKGFDPVIKESEYQLRVGHSYYNQASTKEAHASGEREKVGLPTYLERIDEYFVRNLKSNKVYLTGQPSGNRGSSRFLAPNGSELSYDDIEYSLYAKDQRKDKKSDWVQVDINNILEVK